MLFKVEARHFGENSLCCLEGHDAFLTLVTMLDDHGILNKQCFQVTGLVDLRD